LQFYSLLSIAYIILLPTGSLNISTSRPQRTFTQLQPSNRFNDLPSDATRYGQGRRNTKIKRRVEVWGSKGCWNASTVRNDDADANH